jgi:hypothetical protein
MSEPPPIPVPVATLAYAPPPRDSRPGILTAVAVMSIVLGSLSALYSVGSLFSAIGMLVMSKISTTTAIQATPGVSSGPVKVVTVDGVQIDPAGSPDAMGESQRQLVIDALASVRPINTQHRKDLDLLLENSGQKMFPFVKDSTTNDEIANKVFATNAATRTIDSFDIGTGTIRITDGLAMFRPAGKGEVVVASVGQTPTTGPGAMPPITPFVFRVNPIASILSICENAVSALLAVMLLVAGILLLRNSPGFWRPHWWFVWLKIPLAIVAGVASWMTYTSMMSSFASTPAGPAASSATLSAFMIIPTIIWACFSMAYPVALIFVLSSRAAKSYYAALRGTSV